MSSSSPSTDSGPIALGAVLAAARRRLHAAGVDAAEAEAGWILEHVTALSPAEQVLERGRHLDPHERARVEAAVRRREAREPLAYVLGGTEFYGLPLAVRPGVLVPRPETERLVELVLEEAGTRAALRVLEVGTGSGAIALALSHARAGRDQVAATDVARAALELARHNAERLGLTVELHESDLLGAEAARARAARADVLVANLPYLPDGDRERAAPELAWEPQGALFAGADGLAVARRLLDQALGLVPSDAMVWLELDPRNVEALAAEATAHGWRDARVEGDLTGRKRFLRLRGPARAAAPARTASR